MVIDKSYNKERYLEIDVLKGILIICVIVGHCSSSNGFLKELIFWFHMPCFFIISGFLFKERNSVKEIIKIKGKRLLIPYSAWLISILIITNQFNVTNLLKGIYGGKLVNGVYWYVTCLFVTYIIFVLIEKFFPIFKVKIFIIMILAIIATLESNLISLDKFQIPNYFKLPWALDVALIAIMFFSIGFYGKKIIKDVLKKNINEKIILSVIFSVLIILGIIIVYIYTNFKFKIDMKYGLYRYFLLDLIVPCSFFVILLLVSRIIANIKLIKTIFINFGKASMVIMYVHRPMIDYLERRLGNGKNVLFIITTIILIVCILIYYGLNQFNITRILFIGEK